MYPGHNFGSIDIYTDARRTQISVIDIYVTESSNWSVDCMSLAVC